MTPDEVKVKIESQLENEKVLGVANTPASPDAVFFITQREDKHAPYLVRGYDAKRSKVYEHFVACVNMNAAGGVMNLILLKYS